MEEHRAVLWTLPDTADTQGIYDGDSHRRMPYLPMARIYVLNNTHNLRWEIFFAAARRPRPRRAPLACKPNKGTKIVTLIYLAKYFWDVGFSPCTER